MNIRKEIDYSAMYAALTDCTVLRYTNIKNHTRMEGDR